MNAQKENATMQCMTNNTLPSYLNNNNQREETL